MVAPLVPLAFSFYGYLRWRTDLRGKRHPSFPVVAFMFGSAFLFLIFALFFWWTAWRVERAYANGKAHVIEGRVENYQVSPAGKDVSFDVRGIGFMVSCCDPRPVYRGTPVSGLTPVLIGNGMYVRLTYLATDEIVRIETPDSSL